MTVSRWFKLRKVRTEATSILQRMRDLAVQAANDSLGTAERAFVETETDKLITALENAFDQATFNGVDLIDTNAAVSLTFQVGADNGDTLVSIDSLSGALTVEDADLAFSTAAEASTSIGLIDTALTTIYSDRATLGAIQAQMESTVRNLANVAENTAARQVESWTPPWLETANLTKAQIPCSRPLHRSWSQMRIQSVPHVIAVKIGIFFKKTLKVS